MAHQGVETLLVLLDGAVPREPCELRETVAADGWTEALVGEFLEALPRRHALVLLEGIVPGLRHPGHVVRGEPDPIGGQCTLSSEELLAMVEPVQGIIGGGVGWEVDLAEAGDAQALVEAAGPWRRRRTERGSAERRWDRRWRVGERDAGDGQGGRRRWGRRRRGAHQRSRPIARHPIGHGGARVWGRGPARLRGGDALLQAADQLGDHDGELLHRGWRRR